jgi:2-methylisocitrate lyase-like PEP mutase family enzyme
MVRKIEVALDARTRQDTLIIARTDARTSLGLDEAIHRGKAYAKAGADIIFVEAPESEEEFRRVGGEIDAWLLANMVPTGKSPEIAAERLQAMGFSLAIYPTAGMTAACAALKAAYEHIRAHGTTQGAPISSISMSELHDLVGFPEIWDFEHRFAETR